MEILSLGEKIKRKRKELNMTLKDLAGDRITPGQISLVESGKSNPSMDLLEYLSGALNTSIEYLMESEEAQAEKICTFFENMAEAYMLNGEFDSAREFVEKALYYTEKYNLEYKKAKNLYLRGAIYTEIMDYPLAQQHFLSANVIFIKQNSFEDIINTFIKLGEITLRLKAYNSAYSYFKQAEKVFVDNEIGNDFILADIYYYIALTYYKLEDTKSSMNYALLSKEKFSQLNNKRNYARHLLFLTREHSMGDNIVKAIKYSKKTLEAFKELNHNSYMAEIQNNLGKLFYEFGNYEDSFRYLDKSKRLRVENSDPKLVETLINLCENYIKLRDIKNSKKVLEEITENCGNGDHKALIEYYLLKYKINILENNQDEAENSLLMALEFVTNLDYKKETAEICAILGKFYVDSGQEKKAAVYLSKGVDTLKELGVFKNIQ